MDIKKELGEKIKRIRKQRGLTQEELSEMIDISSRNLSNIELGINFPKAETLEKIVSALNTSTEEIFANNHIKNNDEFLKYISDYIDKIKNDNEKLERLYSIIKIFEN